MYFRVYFLFFYYIIGFYHKTVSIDGFGSYWSKDDGIQQKHNDIIAFASKRDWRPRMRSVLKSLEEDEEKDEEDERKSPYQHVIPPCTIQCQSVEAHGYDNVTEMPKWDLKLSMSSCEVRVVETMLRDTGALAEITNDTYFGRPRKRPMNRQTRRAWWRYAIRQVRYAVASRRTGLNGTSKRVVASLWRETRALYGAHTEYRKLIVQMSKLNPNRCVWFFF